VSSAFRRRISEAQTGEPMCRSEPPGGSGLLNSGWAASRRARPRPGPGTTRWGRRSVWSRFRRRSGYLRLPGTVGLCKNRRGRGGVARYRPSPVVGCGSL